MEKTKPQLFHNEKKTISLNSGFIREINIIDQYSEIFKPLIKKYNTTISICGFIAPAVAFWIFDNLQTFPYLIDVNSVKRLIFSLLDPDNLVPYVEDAMKFIQNDRENYVKTHSNEFSTEKEKENYLRDWVANYEISDYIKYKANPNVIFSRFIERDFGPFSKLNHEEKRRLEEEVPFRKYKFFLDSPNPKKGEQNILQNPEEWLNENIKNENITKNENDSQIDWKSNKIIITDSTGHFTVSLPLILLQNQKKTNTLLVLNSLNYAVYSSQPLFKHLFELWFEGKIPPLYNSNQI
ncbi:hypothetical protein M0811_07581 [Anaeramoeba ignava]|uniref:Uncharacterized protein n=1 Tax=Anaeramoeba ignava TaxID=1746090 RepID=A0A9Q0LLX0_ANAIG|nr:hypothetical protein M0811_07581 [Anaeramoeba ignava]